jgi:hypothetical protein
MRSALALQVPGLYPLCHCRAPAGGRRLATSDALDPGFHGVRTPWIRGFIALEPGRHVRIVMLMGPA